MTFFLRKNKKSVIIEPWYQHDLTWNLISWEVCKIFLRPHDSFFFFFFFFGPCCVACRILAPQLRELRWELSSPTKGTRIKPMPPALKVGSLNHWTNREVPKPHDSQLPLFILFVLLNLLFWLPSWGSLDAKSINRVTDQTACPDFWHALGKREGTCITQTSVPGILAFSRHHSYIEAEDLGWPSSLAFTN